MIDPQFTPPGQHQFLGDVERMMYVLLVGSLCAMRHAPAPRDQWFEAMVGQVDVEMILASRIASGDPKCGWELLTGKPHDASDLFVFYSPGRFALDRDTISKWQERARAGFWLHRDLTWVLYGNELSGSQSSRARELSCRAPKTLELQEVTP